MTLDQFEPARYDDPKLRRAAVEQIELRPDPALTGVQAVVDIETDGGTLTARCEHPRGSAENPLSRAQIESKFRTYADGVLTHPRSRKSSTPSPTWKTSARCESSWTCSARRRGAARPIAGCWPRPADDPGCVTRALGRSLNHVAAACCRADKKLEERREQTNAMGLR